MDNLIIYVISDSVGETAQQVTKAALSQFNAENDCEIRRFPYVADEKFLMEVLESGKNEGAIIVYTLVSENLLNIAKNFCDKEELSHVDLMTPLLKQISNKTGVKPKREPGIIRKLDESYFKRVEAIEFAVKYDDGKDPRGIKEADILLLGVSRTSKTPVTMLLATKDYKVFNLPLVPEIRLPEEVFEIDPKRIIGLTIDPDKLSKIREDRSKGLGLKSKSEYFDKERINRELKYAKGVFEDLDCKVFDVTLNTIEQTATDVLEYYKKNFS